MIVMSGHKNLMLLFKMYTNFYLKNEIVWTFMINTGSDVQLNKDGEEIKNCHYKLSNLYK